MLTLLYLRELWSDDIKPGVKMDLGNSSYKPLNCSFFKPAPMCLNREKVALSSVNVTVRIKVHSLQCISKKKKKKKKMRKLAQGNFMRF